LDPSIVQVPGHTGRWTEDEDGELKDAVNTHGGKDWAAIAALVPGRTKNQCRSRWQDVLDPSVDRANGRRFGWTEDEASKLEDAVQTHGGNNWSVIAAFVPGRSAKQCYNRWHRVLVSSVDQVDIKTNGCTA
jgi:myb proto-oncogene protein